jgi:acetyltransferase-like isoleucine patch superfamily enzyme
MFLGYYKGKLKLLILAHIRNFKLRREGHLIGANCYIDKSVKFSGSTIIKANASLKDSVILGEKIIIGGNSKIAKITIGDFSQIEYGVVCMGHGEGRIIIGKNSYIGINNILDWSDNITIGDNVQIAGPSTGLWTHTGAQMCLKEIPFHFSDSPYRNTAPIIIESNVYIGGNCSVYPGVTIGHHSIIAPNSAVTKDVKPYSLMGGVPAKFIKSLNTNK